MIMARIDMKTYRILLLESLRRNSDTNPYISLPLKRLSIPPEVIEVYFSYSREGYVI